MMKSKKAQMQMFETIAVMIVLLLLLIFGLVIYGQSKEDKIEEKSESYKELNLVELAQTTYSLPEIQCSFAKVSDFGCLDKYKVVYLSKIINDSMKNLQGFEFEYYRRLFGNSRITITSYDPQGDEEYYQLYRINRSFSETKVLYMPIIVYDPLTEQNSFSVMKIEKYN